MSENNVNLNAEIISNENINDLFEFRTKKTVNIKKSPVLEMLSSEGCETFGDYVEWLGLNEFENIVVLSSVNHFYYDSEEMKEVKTIINLKELNQIKDLDTFLPAIHHILSPKTNFIGCFVDNENINIYELRSKVTPYQKKKIFDAVENGILSRVPFLNRIYSMMDMKTIKSLTRKNVNLLLMDHGFEIINMTGINGLTYFCAIRI
jgi:hypothetical protein